ncbi:MAG TPA: hypothetical protein VGL09_03875 [Methylomirabilota bacterium]|jgi:hypothetical protein
MRRPSSRTRPLARGIDALARAVSPARARRRRGRDGTVVVLPVRAKALATDEVLIAIADGDTVALRRIKVTPTSPDAPSALAEAARRLAEIDVVATAMVHARREAAAPSAPLTDAEERLLGAAGLDASPVAAAEAHLVYRGAAEFASLLTDAYTVEEVARLLSVNTSRIRQRLTGTPRTLYGIKTEKGWRIPRFQFDGRRVVSGLDRVVARLSPELHPVAVSRWFTAPSPDLTIDGDRRISPLDWLRLGNAADVVAKLAAGL